MEPIFQVLGLFKEFGGGSRLFFRKPRPRVAVLRDISLAVEQGGRLGIVGESGSGKTTLARIILGLTQATRGSVMLLGRDITSLSSDDAAFIRKNVQMVFQDPLSSLNAMKTIEEIIRLPLSAQKIGTRAEQRDRVRELVRAVGLGERYLGLKPRQLSGGMRQRVGIARALAINPKLLVLDEPTASLDVSVQAKILLLLEALQSELGISQIMISHNLGVIRHVSDQVVVIYLGQVVEAGRTSEIFNNPAHPYTQTLFSAIPVLDDKELDFIPDKMPIKGEPGSVHDLPGGCAFHPRCPKATERCREEEPGQIQLDPDHAVRCHLHQ